MKAKFPGFDADALVAAKVARDAPSLVVRNKVRLRNMFSNNDTDCFIQEPPPLCWPVAGQNWGFCKAATIEDGINYLDNFKGLCGVGGQACKYS